MKNTPIERSRVCFFLALTALAHDRLLSSLFFIEGWESLPAEARRSKLQELFGWSPSFNDQA